MTSAGHAEEAGPAANGIPPDEELPKVLYRVPAHAAWFKYDQIHVNELRGVPEYFAGEPMKTPRASPVPLDYFHLHFHVDGSREAPNSDLFLSHHACIHPSILH
jgi:hypothetical protein